MCLNKDLHKSSGEVYFRFSTHPDVINTKILQNPVEVKNEDELIAYLNT